LSNNLYTEDKISYVILKNKNAKNVDSKKILILSECKKKFNALGGNDVF